MSANHSGTLYNQIHTLELKVLLIRELGRLTDALIEPPEQTALIDETMKVPGVLFAGVPGGRSYYIEYRMTIH